MVKSLDGIEITHTNGSVEAVEHGENPTTTQNYNSSYNTDVPADEMDLNADDYNNIVEDTSYENNSVDEFEDVVPVDLNIESVDEFSPEQLKYLEGQLTKEEYDILKENIKKYYEEYVKYLNNILDGENGDGGLNQQLRDINDLQYVMECEAGIEASANLNDDSKDLYANYRNTESIHKEELEAFGVSTYEELLNLRDETKETIAQIKQMQITMEQLKNSSEFDYLNLREDYENYKPREFTQEDIDELNNYVKRKSTHLQFEMGEYDLEYDYDAYVRDHPDMNITPAEFIQLIEMSKPNKDYSVRGINNEEDLKAIVAALEASPELAQKYNFLYKEDPKQAKEYLKAVKYQINNIKGQLAAKEFLDTLEIAGDDEDALDEAIYNEFGVHIKGIEGGLSTFLEGLYYSVESFFTGENRVMSASEYERMFILQALMSKEDKQKLELINEDGTAVNPNAIIDFSKEYTGAFLKNNYEISQGIGNMLPSIMLSMINPALGSVSLGVSAYGNAYHEAMVSGIDKMNAILYGMITGCSEAITERILGGLPGLSDTIVTGFKSFGEAMLKEGSQEIFQGIMDLGFRHELLGEELPSDWDSLKETALDLAKQGLYGALTAGYMQSANMFVGAISRTKFKNYLSKNNVSDIQIEEAMNSLIKENPDLANLTTEEIIVKYRINLQNRINNILVRDAMKKYGCSTDIAQVIVDQRLNEGQAKYLIEQLNNLQLNNNDKAQRFIIDGIVIVVTPISEENVTNTKDIPVKYRVEIQGKTVETESSITIITQPGGETSVINESTTTGANKHVNPVEAGYMKEMGSFDLNEDTKPIVEKIEKAYNDLINNKDTEINAIKQKALSEGVDISKIQSDFKNEFNKLTAEQKALYKEYNKKISQLNNEKNKITNEKNNNLDIFNSGKEYEMKTIKEKLKETLSRLEQANITDEETDILLDSINQVAKINNKEKIREILRTTGMEEYEIDELFKNSSDEDIINAATKARYEANVKAIQKVNEGKIIVKEGDSFVEKDISDILTSSGDYIKDIEGVPVYVNVGTEENPYYIECIFKNKALDGSSDTSLAFHLQEVSESQINPERVTLEKSAKERGEYIVKGMDRAEIVRNIKNQYGENITEENAKEYIKKYLNDNIFGYGKNRISNEDLRQIASESAADYIYDNYLSELIS